MNKLRSPLTLIASLVCCASFAKSASLIVPRTSTQSLSAAPLAEGQMAYKVEDQNTAELWLGASSGKRLVADPFTLRGYLTRDIPFGEYFVSHTAGITYNATDNSFKYNNNNTGVVENVIFTVADGRHVSEVEYDEVNMVQGIAGTHPGASIKYEINDNVVTFSITKTDPRTCTISISDVYIAYTPDGGNEEVTDLTDLHILVSDTVGEADLSTWRESLRKYASDFDHADRWYKYNGSNAVTMTYIDMEDADKRNTNKTAVVNRLRSESYGNGFWFDGPGAARHEYKLYLDTATTNMCLKAGSLIPFEVSFRGSDTNNFKVSSFSYDGDTHTTTLFVDAVIESFSTANITVHWTTNIYEAASNIWHTFTSSEWHVSGGNIVIPNRTNPIEFYKITYDATAITPPHAIVYLRGEVIVEDGIKIKDFDHVWQVSDGKAMSDYIAEVVAQSSKTNILPLIRKEKRADLVSLSATTLVATNGVVYNASIGAGPLNIVVPAYTSDKSDSFTIRITCTSDTQLGTVQGPSGAAVSLEWLSSPLTAAGSIHSAKAMYLTMTRVAEWTFSCEAKEVQ